MRTVLVKRNSWRQGAVVAALTVAVWVTFLLLVRHDEVGNGESRVVGNTAATKDAAGASAARSAVNTFASFPIARSTVRDTDGDVAYVAEGLGKLAAALELLVRQQLSDTSAIAAIGPQLRAFAVDLRSQKGPVAEAEVTRDAFTTASAAISHLQQICYPELERAATLVADDARDLRGDRPLAEQRMSIDRYFESAADMLRGMAGASE